MKQQQKQQNNRNNNNNSDDENDSKGDDDDDAVDYVQLAAAKAQWGQEAYDHRDTRLAKGRVVAVKRRANPK